MDVEVEAIACTLQFMPVGTIIHYIEMKPAKGGQVARSAGEIRPSWSVRDSGMAILRSQLGMGPAPGSGHLQLQRIRCGVGRISGS